MKPAITDPISSLSINLEFGLIQGIEMAIDVNMKLLLNCHKQKIASRLVPAKTAGTGFLRQL